MVSLSFSTLPWATIVVGALMMSTVNGQLSITNLLSQLSGGLGGLGRSSSDSTSDSSSSSGGSGTGIGGSRVGPFFLFRSSSDNAEVVNEAFRGTPVMRTLGLAFGDEFPKLRDDLIEKSKNRQMTGLQRMMSAFTNLQNWSFDRDNNKKEMEQPYVRPSRMLFQTLRGTIGSLAGGVTSSTSAPAFKISID